MFARRIRKASYFWPRCWGWARQASFRFVFEKSLLSFCIPTWALSAGPTAFLYAKPSRYCSVRRRRLAFLDSLSCLLVLLSRLNFGPRGRAAMVFPYGYGVGAATRRGVDRAYDAKILVHSFVRDRADMSLPRATASTSTWFSSTPPEPLARHSCSCAANGTLFQVKAWPKLPLHLLLEARCAGDAARILVARMMSPRGTLRSWAQWKMPKVRCGAAAISPGSP